VSFGGTTKYNARAAVEASTRIHTPEKEELLFELGEVQGRYKATKRRMTEKYKREFKSRKVIEAKQDLSIDVISQRLSGGTEEDETSSSDEEDIGEDIEGDDRAEPAAWRDLPQEVTIETGEPFSDTDKGSLDQRIEALQTFVKEGQTTAILSTEQPENTIAAAAPAATFNSAVITTTATATSTSTHFYCHLCALDDSTPPDRRTKKWRKTSLDKHLASDYHSKLSILKRDAQSQLESQDSFELLCYICIAEDEDQTISETDDAGYKFKTAQQYVKHLAQVHKYGLKDAEE
jgi:dipeptidyl aminopeptidase/acylaminoacyl peptidase